VRECDSGWERAAKDSPCPICEGDHACSRSPQGLYFCRRARADVLNFRFLHEDRHNTFGVFVDENDIYSGSAFWRQQAEAFTSSPRTKPKAAPKPKAPPPDFAALLAERPATDADVERLAKELGLPAWPLRHLGVGYGEALRRKGVFLFPERSDEGRVIGLLQRLGANAKPNKIRWAGGSAGLHFVLGTAWAGEVLVVEGPTDVAAMLAMRFAAVVGRPSNTGGAQLLADLLGPAVLAQQATVVILGENDAREVGPGQDPWPGRTGAVRVATFLANAWGLPIRYAFPPDGIKDVRVLWQRDGDRAREALLASIAATATTVEPAASGDTARPQDNGGAASGPDLFYLKVKSDQSGPEIHVQTNRDQSTVQTNRDQTAQAGKEDGAPFGPAASRILAEGVTPIRCQKGYAPVLLKKGSNRSANALRVGCRRLSCEVCARYKRFSLLIHAANLFHEHDGPLFTLVAPAGGFESLRKQAIRSTGDYAAVRQQDATLRAILSVPLNDTAPVGPADAVERYAEALLAADADSRRPFLFSKRWKPPPRPQGDSERLGSVPGRKFRELLAKLAEQGLKPVDEGEHEVDGEEPRQRAHWSAPHDWTDGRHLGVVGRAMEELGGKVRGRHTGNGQANGQAGNHDFFGGTNGPTE